MKAGIIIGHLNNKGNEAALLRTAEAFGINHVFVLGEPEPTYAISQGADNHMTFWDYEDAGTLIGDLRRRNCLIVAVENAEGAVPVGHGRLGRTTRYPTNPVFIVGEEGQGVPPAFVDAAEQVRIIEQSPNGYVTCLNTTVAGSIVIHDWYQDCKDRTVNHLEPPI